MRGPLTWSAARALKRSLPNCQCCSAHLTLFSVYYIVPVYKSQVWSFSCSRQYIPESSPRWTESVISEDFYEIQSRPSNWKPFRVSGKSLSCFVGFQIDQEKKHPRVTNKTRIWGRFKVDGQYKRDLEHIEIQPNNDITSDLAHLDSLQPF